MLSMYHFEKVRNLIAAGHNDSEIARTLKIHRTTVARYRSSNSPPVYTTRSRPTKADPSASFTSQMGKWIKDYPGMSAWSIHQALAEQGYVGSLRTIERRIQDLKASQVKERFYEQSYSPGEQSQFDFKESIEIPFVSGPKICHLLIATLPHSDVFFAKAFPNKTYQAFAEGFHSFFERIGGVTENFRFDNLSPVVKKVLKGSERIYTSAFLRAKAHYGFGLLPCSPGKGNEKGDCERDIRTFARRIMERINLKGLCFKDFEDFNIWLGEFAESQLSPSSRERFSEEIKFLKPLARRDEHVLCHVHLSEANKYGTVRVAKRIFSVPDFAILRQVKVVISAYDVKIYLTSPRPDLIATHPLILENQSSILLEHSLHSLLRKPHAMVRWAHREILFPSPIFKKYYKYLQRRLGYGAESEYLKSLNLIQNYPLEELTAGIGLLLEAKSKNPFDDLKTLIALPDGSLAEHSSWLTQCQPPINVELSFYDSLIPA